MRISYDIGIIIIIILLTYMMCGCASTKSTTTAQTYRESHDTITLTITDTLIVEKTIYVDRAVSTTENRDIEVVEKTFREDGTISSETTTRDRSYILQRDSLCSRIDELEQTLSKVQQSSVTDVITKEDIAITTEKKRSVWLLYVLIGFIMGVVAVIIFNKRKSILSII